MLIVVGLHPKQTCKAVRLHEASFLPITLPKQIPNCLQTICKLFGTSSCFANSYCKLFACFANYLRTICMFCELFAYFAGRKEVFARFANSVANSLVKHFLFGQTLRSICTFCKRFAKQDEVPNSMHIVCKQFGIFWRSAPPRHQACQKVGAGQS